MTLLLVHVCCALTTDYSTQLVKNANALRTLHSSMDKIAPSAKNTSSTTLQLRNVKPALMDISSVLQVLVVKNAPTTAHWSNLMSARHVQPTLSTTAPLTHAINVG